MVVPPLVASVTQITFPFASNPLTHLTRGTTACGRSTRWCRFAHKIATLIFHKNLTGSARPRIHQHLKRCLAIAAGENGGLRIARYIKREKHGAI
jgi:hypothetical protein